MHAIQPMQTSFLSRESVTLWQKQFMFFSFGFGKSRSQKKKSTEIYRSTVKYRSKSKFHGWERQLVVAFLVTVPGKQIPVRFWNAIKIEWKQKWCRKRFVFIYFFVCLFFSWFINSIIALARIRVRKKCEASKCASCQRNESKPIENILTD